MHNTRITFQGGTGSVTGSNFLIETPGHRFLIDCGLFQGQAARDLQLNQQEWGYDPASIDYLFVTHAHIDHIGRIPKLVKDGFTGTIYSTEATADLAPLMLEDSQAILESHARRDGVLALYSQEDVKKALSQWKAMSYHNTLPLSDGTKISFHDAGHVLGSAMVRIERPDGVLLATGDLGNAPSPILRDPEHVSGVDYLIIESVYGDRNHETRDDRKEILERAIEDIVSRNGTLLIPIFSLERTQEILFEMNSLVEDGRVPRIPVFLDSPLAIKATRIFKQYNELLNDDAATRTKNGDDIYSFPGLRMTESVEESKSINDESSPKIILAGSGMSHGGRIMHHELHYLEDPSTILLLVGFQGAGTLGRRLEEGAKRITIRNVPIQVRAEVRSIRGYSGHMDSDHLLEFIHSMKDTLKHVYCTMGEPASSSFLAQRVHDYLEIPASSPNPGDSVDLSI